MEEEEEEEEEEEDNMNSNTLGKRLFVTETDRVKKLTIEVKH